MGGGHMTIKEFILKYIQICLAIGLVHLAVSSGLLGNPHNYLLYKDIKYFYIVVLLSMLVGVWLKNKFEDKN
jgi:hypothetical protein